MSEHLARINHLEAEINHLHNLICALQGVAWHFGQMSMEGTEDRQQRNALVGLSDALEARIKAALGECADI